MKSFLDEYERECRSHEELSKIMTKLNLKKHSEPFEIHRLKGGISSKVWIIRMHSGKEIIAKQPLFRLDIQEDWFVDKKRNQFEALFLRYAYDLMPNRFPKLIGHDLESYTLFLEYYPAPDYTIWRNDLLGGKINHEVGIEVANAISRLHEAFSLDEDTRYLFNSRSIFLEGRIDPYFDCIAKKHPTIAKDIAHLRRETMCAEAVVIHGDVSPKNILVKNSQVIIIDAEGACIGDAAFDPSFMLAHLLLKSLLDPKNIESYIRVCMEFHSNYIKGVTWEEKDKLEQRIIKLIGLFLIARIDGKGPAPYIKDHKIKEYVRYMAPRIIRFENGNMTDVFNWWLSSSKKISVNK